MISADGGDSFHAAVGLVNRMDTTSLGELSSAALMDRIDRKFVVPAARLGDVLEQLGGSRYRVLDVDGCRLSRYHTRYFDTPSLGLYHAHHAGRPRRFKVRVRRYVESNLYFLEVKSKTPQGRTVKKRAPLQPDEPSPMCRLQDAGMLGVSGLAPAAELIPSLEVMFQRITLVALDAAERITLDLGLQFSRGPAMQDFSGAMVCELKQLRREQSRLSHIMRTLGFREGMVSKYCLGIAALEPRAKTNQFREVLRHVRRIGASTHRNMEG